MHDSLIMFHCSYCGTLTKRNHKSWHKDHKTHFCTLDCLKFFRSTLITVPCGQCGQPVTRPQKIQKESKSGHLFCSQSCSASYNNAHKTWGTRRSKLEVWLETQLRTIYPDLDLHCNRRDAINAELDIYFPSLKLAFELNGIFHYEPIYGGVEGLVKTQARDAQKFLACHEKGIELCVIDTSQVSYLKPKVAERFLGVVRGVLDKVIAQRTEAGWSLQSTDPTRGCHAEVVAPSPENPPHFEAALAFEKALQWMEWLREGTETRTSLGLKENVNPTRISQLLNMVYIPDDMKKKLKARDPDVGFTTIQQVIPLGRETRGFRKKQICQRPIKGDTPEL